MNQLKGPLKQPPEGENLPIGEKIAASGQNGQSGEFVSSTTDYRDRIFTRANSS